MRKHYYHLRYWSFLLVLFTGTTTLPLTLNNLTTPSTLTTPATPTMSTTPSKISTVATPSIRQGNFIQITPATHPNDIIEEKSEEMYTHLTMRVDKNINMYDIHVSASASACALWCLFCRPLQSG